MDLSSCVIFALAFVVSAIAIFLISFFGVREKTYEEALAEQRQKGLKFITTKSQSAPKTVKEVKHKKVVKKVKEKGESRSESHPLPVVDDKPPVEVPKTEPEAEKKEKKKKEKKKLVIITEVPAPDVDKKEKKKKERKSKHISKDEVADEDVVQSDSVDSQGEEVAPPASSKKPVSKEKPLLRHEAVKADSKGQPSSTKTVTSEQVTKSQSEIEVKLEPVVVRKVQNEVYTQTPAENHPHTQDKSLTVTAKEKKKKKNEINSLLEVDGTGDILSGKGLLPLLHKAVLTDGEIQTLVETLLNKQQQGGPDSEWLDSSGRLDPVSALKKQLADKEQALKDEKDTSQAHQVKLRELRTQLNCTLHNQRTLEESLVKHQQEIQALHARIQCSHDQHVGEMQALQAQLQQVQSKMSEDHVRSLRQLQEEKNQLQQAMSQLEQQHSGSQVELETVRASSEQYETRCATMQQAQNELAVQVRQLEGHVRKQEQQKIEEEMAYKNQICQLTSKLMESENSLSTVKGSLEKLQESKDSLGCHNAILQKKLNMLETSSAKVADLSSQLEEAEKLKRELDLRMKDMESSLEKMTFVLIEKDSEIMHLREENETLAIQITSATTRPAAEGQENAEKQNGDILQNGRELEADKAVQYDILLTEKDAAIEKLSSEMSDYKSELRKIRDELESQREKNNELREKNWKAVEALSAAEKSLEIKMKESDKLVSELCHTAAVKEQCLVKELLQRLFPTVSVTSCNEHKLWLERFESEAQQYLQEIKQRAEKEKEVTEHLEEDADLAFRLCEVEEQNSRLQAQVTHYKIVMDETEGILNKLQNSVESEEVIWKQKFEGKKEELEIVHREKESLEEQLQMSEDQIRSLQEQVQTMEESMEQLHAAEEAATEVCGVKFAFSCVEKSLPNILNEMQEKLQELQEKLQGEETEKRTLALKCDEAHKNYIDLDEQFSKAQEQLNSLHELEKELEEAKSAVEEERKTSKDLSSQVVKLNSLVRIGQDAVNAEQQTVKKLQEQLAQVKLHTGTATTNGPASESPVQEDGSRRK